jgi:hypothetical protein
MKDRSVYLDFNALRNGHIGISATYGSFLAEAASRCLHFHRHQNPALLSITGDHTAIGTLAWCDAGELEQATWADLYEAAEYGAYAVGITVALRLTEKFRVERSVRGTGIDYWISDGGNHDAPFQRTARLEISGILSGDDAKLMSREKSKLLQTTRSDSIGLPAYVAIVEFSRPETRFVQSSAGVRP